MYSTWVALASFCATLFISAMSVVWRFGTLGQRIEQLTSSVEKLVNKIDSHAEDIGDLRVRVAVLENKGKHGDNE